MVEEGEDVETQNIASLRICIDGQYLDAQVSNEICRQIIHPSPTLVRGGAAKIIRCPMPGVVTAVGVKDGDRVKKGDGLIIVEAMKMENEIKAPCSGIIKQINVTQGSMVKLNDELIVLK
jgi:biotin carboxyl carrier protein